MSYNNFYLYNGSVKTLPCSVHNYVFGDINLTQSFKIAAFTIKDKNEVGWFYCSASSSEIDRYVIYNYSEDLWFYGLTPRYVIGVYVGYDTPKTIGFKETGSSVALPIFKTIVQRFKYKS